MTHGGRFHALTVSRIVPETADAVSIVFDIPGDLADRYAYRSGQFVTLRVVVDGVPHLRSYSMSSAPGVDAELQVTVKRVADGPVSSWLNDRLRPGDQLEVSVPAGAFLAAEGHDVVAFAAGSGITPILSIVKSTLHETQRSVRLLYANQDRDSVIFAAVLDQLVAQFPDRLTVQHHRDDESGFVDDVTLATFLASDHEGHFYICGPSGFMDVVKAGLERTGVGPARIHLERFAAAPLQVATPPPASAADDIDEAAPCLTITLGSETKTVKQRETLTILESARWNGIPAPSSCETGHCATCMAQVIEGEVSMSVNDVLTDDEVDAGWVLTCQARCVSPVVRVVYET
ncbi:MAG: ferredoxin--NADP reductase [Frankiaceae bacterium]|nr:ferredoxin--NADP reductase [Frankiaceae bacterium]